MRSQSFVVKGLKQGLKARKYGAAVLEDLNIQFSFCLIYIFLYGEFSPLIHLQLIDFSNFFYNPVIQVILCFEKVPKKAMYRRKHFE